MLCYVVDSNVLVTLGYGFYHFPTTSMPMKWRKSTSKAKKDDDIEQDWPFLATFGPLGARERVNSLVKIQCGYFGRHFRSSSEHLVTCRKVTKYSERSESICWGCALLSTVNLSMEASFNINSSCMYSACTEGLVNENTMKQIDLHMIQ